jgi:hypothetical protein
VFDWDYFMRPDLNATDPKNNQGYDVAAATWYKTFKKALKRTGNKIPRSEHGLAPDPMKEIVIEFGKMRKAKIPLHILIGRRHPDGSSLYWGWHSDAWKQLLATPLDAGLNEVASMIDVLTIAYDLRNPLDEEHLEYIDVQEAYERPAASCPRIEPCPWHTTGNCPFTPWAGLPRVTREQIAAQRAEHDSQGHPPPHPSLPLASNMPSIPPTGEYADTHAGDDSDTDSNAAAPASLHRLTRRAAYEREAVCWQRFWNVYAPKLRSLSKLNVRMPRSFDKTGGVRLAKLLDPARQWRMTAFADERQHMQTKEDLVTFPGGQGVCEHEPEAKIWPAGRFVRRTWVS